MLNKKTERRKQNYQELRDFILVNKIEILCCLSIHKNSLISLGYSFHKHNTGIMPTQSSTYFRSSNKKFLTQHVIFLCVLSTRAMARNEHHSSERASVVLVVLLRLSRVEVLTLVLFSRLFLDEKLFKDYLRENRKESLLWK